MQHGVSEARSSKEAVALLEDWAALILDGHRPDDAPLDQVLALILDATGVQILDLADETKLSILVGVAKSSSVSLIRGVVLDLTDEGRLVAIQVSPAKIKERSKLFSLIGIGGKIDSATDVAENHDEYLVDAYLNAGKSDAAN